MNLFKIMQTTFENYDITIKEYLSKVLGKNGNNYSKTQIFSVIFSAIKGIMQNIMFYIEDAFTEQNIDTAYRKSSVYSLAKLSGYEPYYGSAASGIVSCKTLKSNIISSSKVYIKNKSTITCQETGQTYSISIPTDYIALDVSNIGKSITFKILQGNWKTSTYIANGEMLETISINTNGIFDKDYIEVRVDGKLYSNAACLYDMLSQSEEYVVSSGYDNQLEILFGNGNHGKQLNEGQAVTIKYLQHSGSAGNIEINSGYTFYFSDPIYDSFGNALTNIDYLELSLESDISGGSDPDTIDFVRKMVGYNSRSLCLASPESFKLFLKRFSFIGQANVWCENNSLQVFASCTSNFNNINNTEDYFNASDDNRLMISDYQKNMILTALNQSNKTFAGISFNFIDPIVRKYSVLSFVKISNEFNKESITNKINDAIANYFMNIEYNTTFIAKSDIIKILLEIDGIESADIQFISDSDELAKYNGYWYCYNKSNSSNSLNFVKEKMPYNSSKFIGLDNYGNIQINNMFELPVISNNVSYVDPDNSDKMIKMKAVQVLFI